jgi:hypothetical protein
MFEKYEVWQFVRPSAPELLAHATAYWQQTGYAVTPTTSQTFQGRSVQPRLGFHRLVDITVLPAGEGAIVQLRFRASLTDEGLVAGAVVGVIFLPAAVVGGAISWHEYEEDWSRARSGFWNYLVGIAHAQPLTTASPPSPPPPPPPPPPTATSPAGLGASSPSAGAAVETGDPRRTLAVGQGLRRGGLWAPGGPRTGFGRSVEVELVTLGIRHRDSVAANSVLGYGL